MSRVGNNPVAIPDGVTVDIQADKVIVKGKLGELEQPYDGVSFEKMKASLPLREILIRKNTNQNTVFIVHYWPI